MTLHHSRPAARVIPAPSYQQLSCGGHGTRVSVGDLFGNMPVRVKQRHINLKDPKQSERYFEALTNHMVGLLLAWGDHVTVRVKSALVSKALYIRANVGQTARSKKRPSTVPAVNIELVRSILSQAGHIAPSDWEAWIHTSARSSSLSVEGAISLRPAPSKRTQFISVGVEHIDHSSGDNILYNEVNQLFASSRFGNGDHNLETEQTVAKSLDKRRKQDGCTVKQMKGGGKGVDRWPMFFLRIVIGDPKNFEVELAQSFQREQNVAFMMMKTVRAMIIRFLEDHHFLTRQMPRTIKHRNGNRDIRKFRKHPSLRSSSPPSCQQNCQKPTSGPTTKQSADQSFKSPSMGQAINSRSPCSYSPMQSLLLDTKVPEFRSYREQYRIGPFESWSRIKSGKRENLLEILENKPLAHESLTGGTLSDLGHIMTGASSKTSYRAICATADESTKDYLSEKRICPSLSDEGHHVEDVPDQPIDVKDSRRVLPTGMSGSHSNDDTIQWTNPVSKATMVVNARTGMAVSQRIQPSKRISSEACTSLRSTSQPLSPRNEGTLTLGVCDSAPVPKRATWVNDILECWVSPTFSLTEQRIPQICFDRPNLDASAQASHHGCLHARISKAFTDSSTPNQTTLSKTGLATARVIAQVDKKFILVAIENAMVGENLEQNATKQKEILALIDQHAADERIRVENLFAELCTPLPPQHQPLAMGHGGLNSAIMTIVLSKPIIFETDRYERQLFADHAAHFANWGIIYQLNLSQQSSGTSVSNKCKITVNALPESIAERCRVDPKMLVEIMRDEVWKCQKVNYTKALYEKEERGEHWLSRISSCPKGIAEMLNSRSCRSAIMFNDELSAEQCQKLVQRLAACAFPFQCAHGRPSMIPLVDFTADLVSRDFGLCAFSPRGFATKYTNGDIGFSEAWKQRNITETSHE